MITMTGVYQSTFIRLYNLIGVDWFASDHNFKLKVFYSRYWNMYSTGIDTFTVDWQGVNGLFVPPLFLIPRVLKYMRQLSNWNFDCFMLAVGQLLVNVMSEWYRAYRPSDRIY